MAYVQFLTDVRPVDVGHIDRLRADLSRLHDLLGTPPNFPFSLVEVTVAATVAFRQISGLSKGSPETAKAVCEALRGESLFVFTDFRRTYPINGSA